MALFIKAEKHSYIEHPDSAYQKLHNKEAEPPTKNR